MAHKGKLYELCLRRDFSVNLSTYTFASAKRYDIGLSQCLGTLGSRLGGRYRTLPGGDVNALGIQEWFTALLHFPPFNVKLRLWAKIDGMPQQIFPFVDVIDLTAGLLYTTGGFGPLDAVGAIASLPPLGGAPTFQTVPVCYGPMFRPGYTAVHY